MTSHRPPDHPYRTSDVARAGGVHPNTVRLYERWGYIPLAPRAPNGYQQFAAYHLDQIKLVRLALQASWVSGAVRAAALGVIFASAGYDLAAAQDHARQLDRLIDAEQAQAQAEAALRVLERWRDGAAPAVLLDGPLRIGRAARLLDVSIDTLRNWERNGLLDVPRDPANGYRQYGPRAIARLHVIRTLRRARYSTMAILRMLHRLDSGEADDLRAAIDAPDPDDDIQHATDRWLSTLADIRAALAAQRTRARL
jgi:DNA-binding transcriptional MerR regulator